MKQNILSGAGGGWSCNGVTILLSPVEHRLLREELDNMNLLSGDYRILIILLMAVSS